VNHANVRAICLISGGLDSALAARLMQEQGIDIVALNFMNPFGSCAKKEGDSPAYRVCESLGVELMAVPFGEDYLEVVRHPAHGYGSNVNPCIDCRIYMLKKAKEIMNSRGAGFVVTGEVVGQRPMSQRINTMRMIEKASTLEGYLVRPLSARLLSPTIPEEKGWIRREDLLAISGRSRKELMRLAKQKGISGYSTPGGGCLLTDPNFAQRVRDLIDHDMLTLDNVDLLKIGRHFRLPLGSKLVVGRNEEENGCLLGMAAQDDTILTTPYVPGPAAVLRGKPTRDEERLAAGLVARYSDGRSAERVSVCIRSPQGEREEEIEPLSAEETSALMI
jgi:tRNA-specific 2-thiouridylase